MGIVRSAQQVLGQKRIVLTTNANGTMSPKTIAECYLGAHNWDPPEKQEHLDLICRGSTIQIFIDEPPDSGRVQWIIQWGYGGQNFKRTVYAQAGNYKFVGDWFRINAQIVGTTTKSTATVSAFITPCIDGQVRWSTIWNPFNPPLPDGSQQPGFSYVGADRYHLTRVPATLWRLKGYRYDGGAAITFLQLFDSGGAGFPPPGAPFNQIAGALLTGQIFSIDVQLSGIEFFNGILLAASSTGGSYTQDAGVLLAVDLETLNN